MKLGDKVKFTFDLFVLPTCVDDDELEVRRNHHLRHLWINYRRQCHSQLYAILVLDEKNEILTLRIDKEFIFVQVSRMIGRGFVCLRIDVKRRL